MTPGIESRTRKTVIEGIEMIKSKRGKTVAAIIPIAEIINRRPSVAIGHFSAQVCIILRSRVLLVFLPVAVVAVFFISYRPAR
jgi:hypothetical protein